MSEYIEIPWQKLSQEAFRGMLEELVSRDGTDYGAEEIGEEQKIDQLRAALESGCAVIAFCAETESWSILPKR